MSRSLVPNVREYLTEHSANYSGFLTGRTVEHSPSDLIYTSKATLDTVASTPTHLPISGQLFGVMVEVAGAPSSLLTLDLLLDGVSAYPSSSKPTVAIGATTSKVARVFDRKFIQAGQTKVQWQLTATGSATGPMVVHLLILPHWHLFWM